MSNEEKAEEYSKGKAHEHYHFLFEENNGSPIDFAKLCYLDGLAEGQKEKWHNLREDPNDLPTETGRYLTDDGEYTYDAEYKRWRATMCMACWSSNWLDDGDIIAWCELPKFEEYTE